MSGGLQGMGLPTEASGRTPRQPAVRWAAAPIAVSRWERDDGVEEALRPTTRCKTAPFRLGRGTQPAD